jgi:hypothetical protein
VLTIVVLAVAKVSKNVLPQMAPGFATDYTDEYKERIRPPIVWINAACPALWRGINLVTDCTGKYRRILLEFVQKICGYVFWLCILWLSVF